jgi:hypothetical protein
MQRVLLDLLERGEAMLRERTNHATCGAFVDAPAFTLS